GADADPDIIFDDYGPADDRRSLGAIAVGGIGDGITPPRLDIERVEIRVGDSHIVGDDTASADGDRVGSHEHRADKHGVVPDGDEAAWFDVERSPGQDANPIAQDQPWRSLAAKSTEAVAA